MSSRRVDGPRPAMPLRRKVAWAALAVVALVALVCAGVGVAAFAVVQDGRAGLAGARALPEGAGAEPIALGEGAVSGDGGRTVEFDGARYELNGNMATVCFLGFDRESPSEEGAGAGQADAVIVAVCNMDTGRADIVSIPRESMVEVDECDADGASSTSATMALCLAYAFGDGARTSCENTVRSVSRVLCGMPVSAYFALDLGGIAPLNDAVGGVELTSLATIPDSGIVEGDDVVLKGEDARRYVRWRDESVLSSPLERQARQTQYVKAYLGQLLKAALGNPGTLLDVYRTAREHSVTDLSVNEMSYLAFLLASNGASDIDYITLSGEMRHGASYGEFYLDESAVQKTVLSLYYHRAA